MIPLKKKKKFHVNHKYNLNQKKIDKILKEIIFFLENSDELIENGENKTNYIYYYKNEKKFSEIERSVYLRNYCNE